MANSIITPQMLAFETLATLKASLRYARSYEYVLEHIGMTPPPPWLVPLTPAETEMVKLLKEARAALVARREEFAA